MRLGARVKITINLSGSEGFTFWLSIASLLFSLFALGYNLGVVAGLR